jgi:hypothetical protein
MSNNNEKSFSYFFTVPQTQICNVQKKSFIFNLSKND